VRRYICALSEQQNEPARRLAVASKTHRSASERAHLAWRCLAICDQNRDGNKWRCGSSMVTTLRTGYRRRHGAACAVAGMKMRRRRERHRALHAPSGSGMLYHETTNRWTLLQHIICVSTMPNGCLASHCPRGTQLLRAWRRACSGALCVARRYRWRVLHLHAVLAAGNAHHYLCLFALPSRIGMAWRRGGGASSPPAHFLLSWREYAFQRQPRYASLTARRWAAQASASVDRRWAAALTRRQATRAEDDA